MIEKLKSVFRVFRVFRSKTKPNKKGRTQQPFIAIFY
jgi:hypothetical protein